MAGTWCWVNGPWLTWIRGLPRCTMSTMAVVVAVARLASGGPWEAISRDGWLAILGLALFLTILARLMVLAGIRSLGGAQASLLGLAELFVTLLIAFVALGERLSPVQWVGGVLLMISVVLASRESHLEVSWEDLLRDGRWRELQ